MVLDTSERKTTLSFFTYVSLFGKNYYHSVKILNKTTLFDQNSASAKLFFCFWMTTYRKYFASPWLLERQPGREVSCSLLAHFFLLNRNVAKAIANRLIVVGSGTAYRETSEMRSSSRWPL